MSINAPLVVWLLVTSMFVNLAGLAALVRVIQGRGGIAYLKSLFLKDNEATVDRGSRARRQMFATLPVPLIRPVIFLGDSITSALEWGEAFSGARPILNRGIGGDTSLGVVERLPEVCRLNPVAVFLMIGANDPQMLGYSPQDTLTNTQTIIRRIVQSAPEVKIYLQSVLPSRTPKFNAWGDELNALLQGLQDGRQIKYIDLRAQFIDADNKLDLRFTYDGLHLNSDGYQLWRNEIQPVMEDLLLPQRAAQKALA